MAFGVLMGQIAVIFLEVMLGYAGARCGVITDRDSRFLSDFIMKLLLPCTMLAGAVGAGQVQCADDEHADAVVIRVGQKAQQHAPAGT